MMVVVIAGCGGNTRSRPARALDRETTITTITSQAPTATTPQAPPAPQLVYMYQLQPRNQHFDTVTVNTNGGGNVGYFIGEVAGVKHGYFRLNPTALGRLRRQLKGLKRITVENGGGASAVIYTIIADGHSVRVDQGKIPRKIVGLVANLTGLINRYEP